MRDITYNRLITLMENQYNIMILNGTWKEKSHEQEQIVALTTKILHLKGNLNYPSHSSTNSSQLPEM